MKKLVALFSALFLSFISLPTATADTPVIRIVDVPHRNFDGTFRDNELLNSLSPSGKLGKALFENNGTSTWVIDAALIDEVLDMADGYTFNGKSDPIGEGIAQIWLQQLKIVTIGNPIVALPYGNPDATMVKRLAGSELAYYSTVAQAKLEKFFSRPVISQNGWGAGKSALSFDFQRSYRSERLLLLGLNKVIDAPEIDEVRLNLGRVFNPLLKSDDRAFWSYAAANATKKISNKFRVVSGRYQLTSENVKVPLTLINNFETSTTVSLSLIPMNSRVQVENISNILIPAKSRIQISVPFRVIAPGSTLVLAQFMTPQGTLVGQVSKLNLSLTVIDNRVTWFTTGAAILLFLGAITQSVRRVRRSRNEK
jgi:hypothetical protein